MEITNKMKKDIKGYEGSIEIIKIDDVSNDYDHIFGPTAGLKEITESWIYKDFIRDEIEFMIGYDYSGYYIYRKITDYMSKLKDVNY